MARSANNSMYLPRSWRVVTIAGVTTVGLGFGLVQPAPAEWMKQSAKPPVRSSTRPIPAENGFTATIRRLMSDSRRAAELGDYSKAVQLAERALKISEATAQLLGPTSECSPQETGRLLAEMRAARDGTAPTMVAQPKPTESAPQMPARPATAPPGTVAARPTAKVPAAPSVATRQSQPSVASTSKPQNPSGSGGGSPMVSGTSKTVTAPAAGNATVAAAARNPSMKQATQAGHTHVKSVQQPVPPAPAKEASSANQLLAQSRIAAADGDLDGAIALAKEATGGSAAPSLFGASSAGPQNAEAARWLEHLVAQREAQSQRPTGRTQEASAEVFEPPLRVASTATRKARPAAPVVEPVANETELGWTDQVPSVEPAVASRSVKEPQSVTEPLKPMDEAFWSEELPESQPPTATVVHEPVKFTRRAIDASAGWVDADALDHATVAKEARPTDSEPQPASDRTPVSAEILEPADSAEPIASPDMTPDDSVGDMPRNADSPEVPAAVVEPVATEGEAVAVEPAPVEPRFEIRAAQEAEMTDDAPQQAPQAKAERGPLRLRQHVSQMPAMDTETGFVEPIEVIPDSQPALAERAPLKFRKQPVQNAAFTFEPDNEPATSSEATDPSPVERGPLRLRAQLQQVAAEYPDPAKEPEVRAQRTVQATGGQKIKTLPSTFAEIPAATIEPIGDEPLVDAPVQRFPVQRVLRLRQRIEEASSLNPGGQPTDKQGQPTAAEQTSEETFDRAQAGNQDASKSITREPAQPATRPAVKLRERARLKVDDPNINSTSTAVPKAPLATRKPIVARSDSNVWKSVDSDHLTPASASERKVSDNSITAASQPILPPPITQAGFESADSKAIDLQKTGLNINESAADLKSEFDVAPPPPESADSYPWHEDGTREKSAWKDDVVVRKSSFALIDQLADAFHVPAKTLVSLLMGAGAVLVVGGLVAIRAAMRRRHSA